MNFPGARDRGMVGHYPALVKSGGGYFYDELLEYRVWMHPELGAKDLSHGDDYFRSFPTYEEAVTFSLSKPGAEHPVALVLQREHIDEPLPGIYEHVKEERMAEWQVEWLVKARRRSHSIAAFFLKKRAKKGFSPLTRAAKAENGPSREE